MDPVKIMWSLCIVLATALCVASYTDLHEILTHGRQLKIYLPKNTHRLEFVPLGGDPNRPIPYWDKGEHRTPKGRVSGTGTDRRWYLDKVTFDDMGTYTQRDFFKRELSSLSVKINLRRAYLKRVAGETLSIPLEGLDLSHAQLYFSGEAGNVTLVLQGAPVAQDLAEYWNRVKVHSSSIEITQVNTSDVGYYNLLDQRGRTVSVSRLELVDHHEGFEGNPLMALLLLLGIPAGICCCCRKKIFKKKAAHTADVQGTTENMQPPGQPPCYNTPGGVAPGMVQPPPNPGYQGPPNPGYQGPPNPGYQGPPNPGYQPAPSPGFNPAYPPPQNPLYPPIGPAMVPAQPAMGYAPAPVMYSAPPPGAGENINMENMTPADPLLAPAQPPAASPAAPPGDGYTFQIDGGKNFL